MPATTRVCHVQQANHDLINFGLDMHAVQYPRVGQRPEVMHLHVAINSIGARSMARANGHF